MTEQVAANLLSVPTQLLAEELLTDILVRPGSRIERIVSFGQVTPADRPFLQEWDEWVLILQGAARVMINDQEFALTPGEHLLIPAHSPHWVTFTEPDSPTVWPISVDAAGSSPVRKRSTVIAQKAHGDHASLRPVFRQLALWQRWRATRGRLLGDGSV